MSSVASRRSGMYSTQRRPRRDVEPDGRDALARAGAETTNPPSSTAAALSGWRLDGRGDLEQRVVVGSRQRRPARRARRPRRPRPRSPRPTSPARASSGMRVVHRHPPADARRAAAAMAASSAASRPATNRFAAVAGSSTAPSPATVELDRAVAVHALDGDVVDEVQRQPEAVVARPEVGGRRRDLDGDPAPDDRPPGAGRRPRAPGSPPAERPADVGDAGVRLDHLDRDPASAVVGSLRPLPVSTHTTVRVGVELAGRGPPSRRRPARPPTTARRTRPRAGPASR